MIIFSFASTKGDSTGRALPALTPRSPPQRRRFGGRMSKRGEGESFYKVRDPYSSPSSCRAAVIHEESQRVCRCCPARALRGTDAKQVGGGMDKMCSQRANGLEKPRVEVGSGACIDGSIKKFGFSSQTKRFKMSLDLKSRKMF